MTRHKISIIPVSFPLATKNLRISHFPNEAQKENYQGLHQWNLDEWNGNLIVSQKGHHINLGRIIEQQKLMSISRAPNVEGDKGEITVKLQKLRDCNLTQSLMIQTRS